MDRQRSPGFTKHIYHCGNTTLLTVEAEVMLLYQLLAGIQYVTSVFLWEVRMQKGKKALEGMYSSSRGSFAVDSSSQGVHRTVWSKNAFSHCWFWSSHGIH